MIDRDAVPIRKGDMLWVKLEKATNEYGYGEVEEVWFDTHADDFCYTFYCLVNGGTRIGQFKKLIEKPTNRMQNKYLLARKEYNEAIREFLKN